MLNLLAGRKNFPTHLRVVLLEKYDACDWSRSTIWIDELILYQHSLA